MSITKNKTIVITLVTLLVALSFIQLHPLHTQTEGGVQWIFWVSDQSAPIGKPIMVKVWAYDSEKQETYDVSCNITFTTQSDVVLMDKFSGNPAIYNFTFWKVDNYDMVMYCSASTGDNTTYSNSFTFYYPSINITPTEPNWGRNFTLKIQAEYTYNKTAVVTVGSNVYNVSMVNGVIEIPNQVIYDKTPVTLYFLNRTTKYTLIPKPPELAVTVNPSSVKVNQQVEINSWFYDENGLIPVVKQVLYNMTGCSSNYWIGYTGTPTYFTPTTPGTCTVTATYSNSVFTVSGSATFTVNEPLVTNHTLKVSSVTPWDYTVYAVVKTDAKIHGNMTLTMDGDVLKYLSKYGDEWEVTLTLKNVTPGVHEIDSIFMGDYGISVIDKQILVVPRHPYTIEYNESYTIPFGEDINQFLSTFMNGKYKMYTVRYNTSYVEALIYYPGNWYYLPAKKLIHIRITYPQIHIVENNAENTIYFTITNGHKGARITIYGVKFNGTGYVKEILYQENMSKSNISEMIPQKDVDYVYLVYEYGTGKLIVKNNEVEVNPEPYKLVKCIAGIPCVPVAPDKHILAVYIANKYYKPGTNITLPPGSYLLIIKLTDGYEIGGTISVENLTGKIEVYYNPYNPTLILIPDSPFPINVVLSDGKVLTIKGPYGKWIQLPGEIVNAYTPWGKVVLEPLYNITD